MTDGKGIVPVLAVPMLDPAQGRIDVELPAGLTITQIIEQTLPDRAVRREYIRVALVSENGSSIVLEALWDRLKPRPGVRVVIRIVPGKGALKSILSIVVAIAAVAIGAFFAPMLAGTLGISQAGWQGIIGLGVTVVGNLLINALIPPPKPDNEQKNRYTISGWRNRLEPDGAVPVVLGDIRFAPPFAVLPHTQIIGDDQYICAAFNVGYGRVLLDDFRIGETSLGEYTGVEIEVREGVAGDLPLRLIPTQIAEETVGADLTRPKPRDELGEIISGPTIETPVVRTTGADASGASVIYALPAGLFRTDDEGRLRKTGVSIKIQQRLVQAEEWQDVTTLEITARKREGFYRQHTWLFPSRGRWQVRSVMMTDETTSMQVSNRTAWAVLQTLRPEYPINFHKPLALIAVRVKATHQLNGQLDNFNVRARRVCLDCDQTTDTWVERPSRNPASLYRYVLQSAANARPASDDGINLEELADWHNFCRLKGLKYDRVIDDPSLSLRDVLKEIAAAGRATPRHDGRQWGVVIDRPQLIAVDHFSPRNSFGFKATKTHVRRPDGIRVQFLDETNDNKPTERYIPWPGNEGGPMNNVERMELPGKTDPAEIYRETRRRMYEIEHRPEVYRLSLDSPIGVATRGDKVMVSQDTLDRTQIAARVRSARGRMIEIDETVTMVEGVDYVVRFRVFEVRPAHLPPDTVGTSIIRPVITRPGETSLLALKTDGELPQAGDLVLFGTAGKESMALVVTGVEAGEDLSSHLRLVDAAPIIDELTDALEIPAWSGRVGAEIDQNLLQPPAPRFTSIVTGMNGTDRLNGLDYLIEPGSGAILTASFQVEHRLVGAPVWTPITVPAAAGGGEINSYTRGQDLQLRARAISPAGIPGPYTATIPVTIGSKDVGIPTALDASKITVGALLGGAVIQLVTSDDAATTRIQVYRSQSAVLDRATDAVKGPVPVEQSRSYSLPTGDATRENLLLNGVFDTDTVWGKGTGWTIGSGKASKTAGTASALSQALAAQAGKWYRVYLELSGVTASTITPRLTGGTTRNGTARAANGFFSDRIQAVTGNSTFELSATSTFVGSVDNVGVYLETTTCLAQGVHYIWLEPQNDDGVPGPVAGPFTVTIL